jgi:hypothetical protein
MLLVRFLILVLATLAVVVAAVVSGSMLLVVLTAVLVAGLTVALFGLVSHWTAADDSPALPRKRLWKRRGSSNVTPACPRATAGVPHGRAGTPPPVVSPPRGPGVAVKPRVRCCC